MSLIRHHILSGGFHPYYIAILNRAILEGYSTPTIDCMRLQNQLVVNLVNDGIWALLDYLYIYAQTSANVDFIRINWPYPTRAVSTGSPTDVPKKGIYGSITHNGFDMATDRIAMTANTDCSIFTFLTENGGTISTLETLASISGANTRIQGIRLRTNPRVDYVFNTTAAGASALYNAFPLDNHFYHADTANIASVIHGTVFINGVNTVDIFPAGAGLLPDTGFVVTQTIDSSRALGLIGGGGSIHVTGKATLLYTHLSNYMTAVQALP